MFAYCLDCCNPESPTFSTNPNVSLYSRIDMYRNPPGHTFMRPDAVHGQVSRYGKSLAYVSTTHDWATRVTEHCRGTSAKPILSVCMNQSLFGKWLPYLKQMYRSSILKNHRNGNFSSIGLLLGQIWLGTQAYRWTACCASTRNVVIRAKAPIKMTGTLKNQCE